MRHVPVVGGDHRLGVQEIVLDHPGLVVGHVLELVVGAHVAEREDAGPPGLLVLVDDHVAVLVQGDPGGVEVEPVPVGDPPGGQQQHVGGQGGGTVRALDVDGHAGLGAPGRGQRVLQPEVHPSAHRRGEPGGDLGVLLPQQRVAATHQGHVGAVRGEDVGELRGHVAGSDDDHRTGQLRQPHHGVRRLVRGVAQPVDRRDPDPGTGGDHEPVGGDLGAVVEPEPPVADEAGVLAEQVDVGALGAVALAVGGDRVDPTEDAVTDVRPAHAVEGEVHPQRGGVLRGAGQIGRVDVHLGGDAADVEAGAAERVPALDQGDAPVVEALIGDGVGRTTADQAEVDVSGLRHGPIVPARDQTNLPPAARRRPTGHRRAAFPLFPIVRQGIVFRCARPASFLARS